MLQTVLELALRPLQHSAVLALQGPQGFGHSGKHLARRGVRDDKGRQRFEIDHETGVIRSVGKLAHRRGNNHAVHAGFRQRGKPSGKLLPEGTAGLEACVLQKEGLNRRVPRVQGPRAVRRSLPVMPAVATPREVEECQCEQDQFQRPRPGGNKLERAAEASESAELGALAWTSTLHLSGLVPRDTRNPATGAAAAAAALAEEHGQELRLEGRRSTVMLTSEGADEGIGPRDEAHPWLGVRLCNPLAVPYKVFCEGARDHLLGCSHSKVCHLCGHLGSRHARPRIL
mmetsp:Transcript_46312/g.138453  ORF Transcript_46312/g.138453 Transcript_46312/m.138453 type:complete len:286 (-) Transcript_46312:64-921(-)